MYALCGTLSAIKGGIMAQAEFINSHELQSPAPVRP